jgi:hypothetical protein
MRALTFARLLNVNMRLVPLCLRQSICHLPELMFWTADCLWHSLSQSGPCDETCGTYQTCQTYQSDKFADTGIYLHPLDTNPAYALVACREHKRAAPSCEAPCQSL